MVGRLSPPIRLVPVYRLCSRGRFDQFLPFRLTAIITVGRALASAIVSSACLPIHSTVEAHQTESESTSTQQHHVRAMNPRRAPAPLMGGSMAVSSARGPMLTPPMEPPPTTPWIGSHGMAPASMGAHGMCAPSTSAHGPGTPLTTQPLRRGYVYSLLNTFPPVPNDCP
jgi:hypothetical protein